MIRYFILVLAVIAMPTSLFAGEADIVTAIAKKTGPGVYHISVTVRHADEGWDHYANRWEVLNADRQVIATRVLGHPHEDEQPFTRSLFGVKIPDDAVFVIIRAHDSVHEYGGVEYKLALHK